MIRCLKTFHGRGVFLRMKKIIGFVAFFIAIGMLIMLIAHNRLVGLIIIALLLFVGYHCICSD